MQWFCAEISLNVLTNPVCIRCVCNYGHNKKTTRGFGVMFGKFNTVGISERKDKLVSVLDQLSTSPWTCIGSGCINRCFLALATSWRWVVSLTLWPQPPPPREWPSREAGWNTKIILDDMEKWKYLTLPWLVLRTLWLPGRNQLL
jgi:hypothetical protein